MTVTESTNLKIFYNLFNGNLFWLFSTVDIGDAGAHKERKRAQTRKEAVIDCYLR